MPSLFAGSCNPYCANGGTCIGPDVCQCPDNFSGSRCEARRDSLTKEERPRRSKLSSREQQLKRQRVRAKRQRSRRQKLGRKLEKAEKRLLKILFRDGKSWNLSREERRVLRRLQREHKSGLLMRRDRKFLVQTMTRERGHLKKKYRKSLRRYKKLLKKMRKAKLPKKAKKREFV
ncbi:hypothetical protein ACOMHN_034014 [Nucella lapillus]